MYECFGVSDTALAFKIQILFENNVSTSNFTILQYSRLYIQKTAIWVYKTISEPQLIKFKTNTNKRRLTINHKG